MNFILKKLSILSALFLLLGSFQLAAAQSDRTEVIKKTKFYDVEVIIFKNIKVPKGEEKILPAQAPSFDERFIDLSDPSSIKNAAQYGYSIPAQDELRLNAIEKKISHSRRYKLLVHTAWRQPGLERAEALSFKIRGGDVFGSDYSSIDKAVDPTQYFSTLNSASPSTAKTRKASLSINNNNEKIWHELEGKITISLARYLHAYVDLVLRIPSDNSISINTNHAGNPDNSSKLTHSSFVSSTLNNFSLKEHRRMRSRKLHYLDNPELGMLILITPYEAPEAIDLTQEPENTL